MHDLASFVVDLSGYRVVKEIFKGDTVTVHLVQDKETQKTYAAKTYYRSSVDKDQVYFIREADMLRTISHPSVIVFRGFSLTDMQREFHPVILTDFQKNGSLRNIIEDSPDKAATLTNTKKQIIILGIASAMEYVHKKGFIHRDLKLDSIMIDENYYPLVGGFDLCQIYTPGQMKDEAVGHLIYMAPELLNDGVCNFSIDVYSFSIILYQILGFGKPYDGETKPFEIAMRVSRGERPKIPAGTCKAWIELLESCWHEKPEGRPSFAKIVEELCTNEELIFPEIDRSEYERYKFKMLRFYSQ